MANAPLTPLEKVLSESSQPRGLPEFKFDPVERVDARAPSKSSGAPGDLLPLFEGSASKHNVPVNILLALGDQESKFNARAIGQPTQWGRAKGLMQYLDSTAANLGINPYDPAQAIDGAARQIRERLDKGYSMEDAVKEHFAGPNRKMWGAKTAQYGKEVMEKAAKYGSSYKPSGAAVETAAAGDAPIPAGNATIAPSPLTIDNQKAYERKLTENMLADLNKEEPGRYSMPTPEQMKMAEKADPLIPASAVGANAEGADGFISATSKSIQNIPNNFRAAAGGLVRMLGEGVDDSTLYWSAVEAGILDQMRKNGDLIDPPASAPDKVAQFLFGADPNDVRPRGPAKLRDGTFADPSAVAKFLRENAEKYQLAQLANQNGIKPNPVSQKGIDIAAAANKDMLEINPNGPLAKYGSMIIGSTAEMVPALLAGIVTRNPNTTLAMIGTQVTGQSYDRARENKQNPLNPGDAASYALAQAAAEAIPSALPVHIILQPGKNFFAGLLKAGAAESLQEGVTAALQAGIDKGSITPDMTWGEAMEQIRDGMIVGAGSGAMMKAGVDGGRKAAYELRGGAEGELARELNRSVESTELPGDAREAAVQALDPNQQAPVVETPVEAEPAPVAAAPVEVAPQPVEAPAAPSGPLGRALERANPMVDQRQPAAERVNIVVDGIDPIAGELVGESDSSVSVRGDDGSTYEIPKTDIEAGAVSVVRESAPVAEPVQAPVQEPEQAPAPEPVQQVEQPAQELTQEPVSEQGKEPAAEQAKQEAPAREEPKSYDQMDEAELRGRLKYLAGQARSSGGWNKMLMTERRKVESAIDALAKSEPEAAAQPTTQEAPAAEPVKWFGSKEKAEAFIAKKGMADTHQVVQNDRRFEIQPKATAEESSAVEAPAAQAAPIAEPGQEVVLGKGQVRGKVTEADAEHVKIDFGNRVEKMTRATFERRQEAARAAAPKAEAKASVRGKEIDGEWSEFAPESGTRGVPRADMPQIKAEHRGAMTNFINARDVSHREETISADTLKPTQAEFSRDKVAKAIGFDGGNRSILVSRDGHILDGHHQWMAALEKGEPVKAIRFDANIDQLLELAREFPIATQADGASSAAQPVAKTPTPKVDRKQAIADAQGAASEVLAQGGTESDATRAAADILIDRMADDPSISISQDAPQAVEAAKPVASKNTIFTEDAAAKARAILKSKLTQLNSGIDPEIMQAGITLAGYHIEKGARTFTAYAKAMVGDLGDAVRPYLKSWYMGTKYDPRAAGFDGMSTAAEVEAFDLAQLDEAARNEPEQLDQPSQGSLEGTPAAEVPGAESSQPAGERPARGSRTDTRRNERAGSERNDNRRGVGSDEGAVPVPAGRERAGRGASERPSVQRGDGRDSTGRADRRRADGLKPESGKTAQQQPSNYTITDADAIGQGGAKSKFKSNVEAIRLLKQLESEGRTATADEQAVLAKYVGWGGIPQAFHRSDNGATTGWAKEVAELKELLTPEEYSAAASSTKNAHYTSPEIVRAIWDAVARLGFKGGRVLEPSVGAGNFFGLMPHELRKASALSGVELDRVTSGIAAQLYPDAKIARMGFQDFVIPDGYFDIAIGNPPFGRESLYDGKRKDLSGFSIHNYFFAKSLDGLRPGGVLAMVVTNRMMDVPGDKARQYMASRADFLGAIRLPNDAFMANAGTSVTTDVIFMRKRAEGERPAGESWMKVEDYKDKDGNTVPVNEYFARHPEMMLGDFGAYGSMYREGEPALIARDGQDTAAELRRAIASLPEGVMSVSSVKPETAATVRAENVRVGSMFVDGDTVKVRGEDVLGENTATDVTFPSEKARERVLGMIGMRDALARLRGLQLNPTATDRQIEAARKDLNAIYDSFVKANGPVNLDANKRLFRDDPTWPQLSALEDGFDKGISATTAKSTGEQARKPSAKKAAIFSKRTQSPYQAPTSASSARDALVSSLSETGRVDMDMMSRLYGKSEAAIVKELGDLVFQDPVKGYVTRDEYLSGNVKAKLAQARAAAADNAALARNVEALEAVQPADVEAVDINVKPGAAWVPQAVMSDFANVIGEGSKGRAVYNPTNAKWSILDLDASQSARQRFATDRVDLKSILEAAANQKTLQVYDQHADGSRTLNETETQLANDKVNSVKEEWGRWVWSDDTRRTDLARLYNDMFNTNVPRQYDGSHLTLPGKVGDDIIRMRPHQLNAVWRIVQGDPTLTDHVVGAGKTFTLIAAAMEMRRMGLAKKPMFAVPNHLVGQWAADFVKLYPGANILAATKKDFEKENRKRLFARIATGDWDAVIVAHSSFGKVEVEPKAEAAFIEEQVADLDASIEVMRQTEGKASRNVKDTAKRRDALREKIKKLLDAENKDDSLYWGELGVDALFLDEAQEFKNLAFSTSMNRVAGLGNQQGSQKASDMFLKVRQVLESTGGRNVTFATGTPISNTMAEMYTMQRYLDYTTMKNQGLSHFDAWARMFGEVVTDWELSPSGKYKMNSRFAKFVNMPELMQRYMSFADVINRDDINRMLAAQGKKLPVPKIKGGKPQNVVVERSRDQAAYIGEPIKDAEGNDTEDYPRGSLVWRAENMPKKAEKGADNMLKIMGDARKAALDMRLIDPSYPDYPGSKVNQAARNIKADYDRWDADKGVQLVFIDLSTPKNAKAGEAARIRDLAKRAEEGDEQAAADLDKLSPDELMALDSDFSVYDDLKQKLVVQGIPEGEIAFIHDAKTDLQKEDLFGKARSGRIRVLLGSTAKMGAGTNVQDRLVALHHLDAPWRPSDLEQREGRIIRQGNKLYERDPEGFEVGIYRYATKQTLDSRMWQTIEGKANFIEQVRKGNGSREVEDVSGEASNAAEMKAASSGNPLILEEMSLRQKVRKLENERMNHDREQHRLADNLRLSRSRIDSLNKDLGNLRKDAKLAIPGDFAMTVDGQTFTKRADAGEAILAKAAEMEAAKEEFANIGKFGGFNIGLERIRAERFNVTLEASGTYDAAFEIGADPLGLTMRITNMVKDLPADIERAEAAIAKIERDIPKLEAQAGTWAKAEELSSTKGRHANVLEQLKPKRKELPTENKASMVDDLDRALAMTEDQYIAAVNPEGKVLDADDRMSLKYGDLDTPEGARPVETFKDNGGRDVIVLQADGAMYAQVDGKTAGMIGPFEDGETVIDLVEEAKRQGIGTGLVKAYIRQNPLAQSGGFSPAGEATRRAAFRQLRAERQSSMGELDGLQVADLENVLRTSPLGDVLGRLIDNGSLVLHDIAPSNVHTQTQGWTDRQGKMHLVASQLTGQSALPVTLHEAFHAGSKNLLQSERWLNLMARLNGYYKAIDEGRMQGEWADAFRRVQSAKSAGDGMSRMREIEELGAYAIENYERAPAGIKKWVDGLIGAIKDFMYRRFGLQFGDVSPAQLRALAAAVLRNPQLSQGDSGVRASIRDNAPTDQEIEGWFSRQLTDAMSGPKSKGQYNLLALAPMDRMIEELSGDNRSAQEYLNLKRDMDAYRAKKHTQFDTTAQKWLKLNVTNREAGRELASLMHEATVAQTDPAEPFQTMMTKLDNQIMATDPDSEDGMAAFKKKAADEKRKVAHAELQARFRKLPAEFQAQYREVRDTYKEMSAELDQILVDNMAAAMDIHGRKAERVYDKEIAEIRDEGLTGADKEAAEAAALKKYNTAMTKLKWNKQARMTQLRQQFESNRLQGPYFPLARFGDYFVTVRDRDSGEVLSFSRFESRADQQRFASEAKRLGKVQTGLLSSDSELRGAVDPRFVADVEDILGGSNVPDSVKDQVWQRYLESMPDMSMRKGFIHRKSREGFSQDALRAFASRMFHGAHQMGRLKFGARMQEAIDLAGEHARKSKTPERDTAVVNEIGRRHDYVMNPKGAAWAQRLTSAAFIYHLSMSPAAALVNVSQTVILGVPIVGAQYGVAKTAAAITRALKDFTMGRGRADRSKGLNDDERKAMAKAYETGLVESTQSHNLAGVGETGVEYSAVRNKVMGVLAWMFHQAERLNREVTFLSTYRLAKGKGMDSQRAIDEAIRLTYKVHFDYSNTNRPRAMHGDAAKVALVFRNYQVNMLWRLFRDMHQTFSGDTKAARTEALKQMGGITGMMALSAGVKGMWGYGLAMALASLFFGDDAEDEFKKGTVELLGPTAAGMLLNGTPGHLTGTSLSGRIGMPDLWFRSPDRQLEGKDEFNYWQSQLLGALPGIAQNMWTGFGQIRDGKTYRGIETMSPKFVKDLMRTARFANEGATTLRGDPLVDNFKPGELLAQMMGFTPAVIAEQYERNSSLKNAEKRILDERRNLIDRYAAANKLDDVEEQDAILDEMDKFSDKYPEVKITPQTIMQSLKARQRFSDRTEGGVTLNPKLDERLRDNLGGAIYR